jgi:uncharacterized membrane protein
MATATRRTHPGPASSADDRSLTVAGLLLGIGLGGFVDGIVMHQVLQWHHLGTGVEGHSTFTDPTPTRFEDNTLWDGLFHLGALGFTLVGLYLLWRASRAGHPTTWLSLTGLLLAGWGLFDLVEGVVNHHLLGIHHVRDDLGGPVSWDIGFLVFGAVLVVVGLAMHRADRRRRHPTARST